MSHSVGREKTISRKALIITWFILLIISYFIVKAIIWFRQALEPGILGEVKNMGFIEATLRLALSIWIYTHIPFSVYILSAIIATLATMVAEEEAKKYIWF